MNNAHILSFAAPLAKGPRNSHLGSGTSSNTALFNPTGSQAHINIRSEDINDLISITRSNQLSNSFDSSNSNTNLTDQNGRKQLEARLAAQRHSVQQEIVNIINRGRTDKLYCDVYSMVLLLYLHKRSEEGKLWDFTNGAITSAIENEFVPELQSCLTNIIQAHAADVNSHIDLAIPLSSVNTNSKNENDDEGPLDPMGWVVAARGVYETLDKFVSRISLLHTILGTHVNSNRKRTKSGSADKLKLLNESLNSMRINGVLACIPFELVAKEAITFFLDRIDDINMESLLKKAERKALMEDTSEKSHKQFQGFSIEMKKKSLPSTDSIESGDDLDQSLLQSLEDAGSFFTLVGKLGDNSKLMLSVDERLGLLFPSGFSRIQRALRRDPETYVRKTYLRIVKVYQFLIWIGKSDEMCASIIWSITWRHLLQDLSQHLPDSFPDLITQQNRTYLKSLETVLMNSEPRFAANSSQILLHAWVSFVQKKTQENLNASDPLLTLLELKKELHQVAKDCFSQDSFSKEIPAAMRKALGQREISNQFIQQLARFCENGTRRVSKGIYDAAFIPDALLMFDLVTDKDGFADVYAKDLSRRLLTSKALSISVEQELVEGLIAIVGVTECTGRLVDMVRDYQSSKLRYKNLILQDSDPQIEFCATVLQKKIWTDVPSLRQDLIIPPQLSHILSEFEALYKSEDKKKEFHVLDWSNYMLHQLSINVCFSNGVKELVVNLYQAVVLLAFQNDNMLEIQQLAGITGLAQPFLIKVLNSLSSAKYSILRIEDQVVTFNSFFWDKAFKIRIPMIKERDNMSEEMKQTVLIGQSSKLEAAIVRNLKARRSAPYTVFLAMILENFSWVGISEIKRMIEKLIDSGYARRSEDNDLQYVP